MDKKNILIIVAVAAVVAIGAYFAFFQKKDPMDNFNDAAESLSEGVQSLGE